MTSSNNSKKSGSASTYIVDERKKKAELQRLSIQSHMITTAMGGVLPEQPEPESFHRVLEIGCGVGEWALEVAQTYPQTQVIGIDINPAMVEHSRNQAKTQGLENRVEFKVMDALNGLEFPDNTFDLVNLRFGISFVRTWDWPKLLLDMQRVAVPGGVIRLTECETCFQCTSQAATELNTLGTHALYQAGYLFTDEYTGLTGHLEELLTKSWCEDVQTKFYALTFKAGTQEGDDFKKDANYIFQVTRPFIQKWTSTPGNLDALQRQAHDDMEQPDFVANWPHLTVWGRKPLPLTK